jgi:hypothetical protein
VAGIGPPPKPPGTARGHRRHPGLVVLPAAGRSGKTPPWPLVDDIAKQVYLRLAGEKAERLREELPDCPARSRAKLERELDAALQQASVLEAEIAAHRSLESQLWAELWATPQAAQWDALGWHRDVAQYVRHKVRGELGSLDDAKEARQWSDRLGLNPLAMLRLRWEFERVEAAEDEGRKRRAAAPKKPAAKRKPADPREVLRLMK